MDDASGGKAAAEGPPFQADATGFGTFLYSRLRGADVPRVPGTTVMHARTVDSVPEVDFVPLAGVEHYDVLRADRVDGRYRRVGRALTSPVYRDETAEAGRRYFYRVGRSLPVPQMAGLPQGWHLSGGSSANFDGDTWRLSSGNKLMVAEMESATGIVARLLPLVASSGVRVGLCVDGEPALLILPTSGPAEHPQWSSSAGTAMVELQAPMVSRGRLTGAIWLRLVEGRAAISADGVKWIEMGPVKEGKKFGLCVSSGIDGVETEVIFDQVNGTRI